MRRVIPPSTVELPAYGWCFSTPKKPATFCSWCGEDYETFGSFLMCLKCDQVY